MDFMKDYEIIHKREKSILEFRRKSSIFFPDYDNLERLIFL